MSIFKRKPKLPPIPRGPISTSEPSGQEQKQGDRMAIEVDGHLVWVDSSRLSETTKLSEEQLEERIQQQLSEMKRKYGISEK